MINRAGHSFLSYVYEPGLALPVFYEWLQQQPGVRLVERKLAKVDEVMHSYQLVVNCTGVGAKYFVDDSNITPISGQVLRVQAPWLHFVVASADDVYIIPKSVLHTHFLSSIGIEAMFFPQ
jgi:glycine/D-amino acid oxidase-like deaminating enzyme